MIKINDVLIGGQFCTPDDIIYIVNEENKRIGNKNELELELIFKDSIVVSFFDQKYLDLISVKLCNDKLYFKIEDRNTKLRIIQSDTMVSLQDKIINKDTQKDELSIYSALHTIMCIIGDIIRSDKLLSIDFCNCELVIDFKTVSIAEQLQNERINKYIEEGEKRVLNTQLSEEE